MKKIFSKLWENILFIATLLLLVFIPLYPKLPLINVTNTWVYIRLEDVVVLTAIATWFFLLVRNKITLKTPLTLPIMIFWVIGGISTLHGVLVLFPTLPNVFSNVAFLSYLRRIEYMFLFFVAFSGIKNKKFLPYIPILLSVVLFIVALYGFGQKFLGLPAFLTGNEEFAKGIPLRISSLGRVSSTFAGDYDLAAYLVLIIPILVSSFFAFKNILLKSFLLVSVSFGFILMFLTVSRISFFVLLLSLLMVLIIQKKKIAIISLFCLVFISAIVSPSLLTRFQSTVSKVNVLVDTKTGESLGHVQEVPQSYFKNKLVLVRPISEVNIKDTTSSAIFPFKDIPPQAQLIIESNKSNGESLPQGSSYINLSLSPVVKTTHYFFLEKVDKENSIKSGEIRIFFGDYVVKNVKAYDISFTTRFQGEWPKTLQAFQRNIFIGSGYGSVSLAVDNDYLRILGESGILGLLSFVLIFMVSFIYINKILLNVDSKPVRSFILGFVAGSFGLALNAVFIDVFEASKIAFTYWLLMGVIIGGLSLYKDANIDFYKEIKKILSSPYTVIIFFIIAVFLLFSGIISFYFIGDDFTWLRWASECNNCRPLSVITQYFIYANGFFYRPGAKLYFYLMYNLFWFNQIIYHFVSIFLHLINIILLFFISRKIFKNFNLAIVSTSIFIVVSSYSEIIFWIAATGHLITISFILLGLLAFIKWRENKNVIYFIISFLSVILSLLFQELGIISPLLIILYDAIYEGNFVFKNLFNKIYYYVIFFPVLPYLLIRLYAKSHWLSGDYSYNLIKLPFNAIGNLLGYLLLTLSGPISLNYYEKLRILMRENVPVAFLGLVILFLILVIFYKLFVKKFEYHEKKIILFSILFFIVSLIPFLGLGNIASRYSYLSSFGICLLLPLFLKKIYDFLVSKDKYVAILGTVLIVIFFLSIQLFQFQKVQSDWSRAGEKTKSFLSSLENAYVHYGVTDSSTLYFVNVPIRNGEAWIFPVGLSDAVNLLFPDKHIIVNQVDSVENAFAAMGENGGRVFKFNQDGSLVEWIKNIRGELVPRVI